MPLGSRIVIIGASGSGKTTMARQLGAMHSVDVLELDPVHWSGKVGVQREESEALEMAGAFAARQRWVVEGVYGWLAAPAVIRADMLIWLDLPWTDCRDGLNRRGPWVGASAAEHAAFLDWAEAYWSRKTSSSFEGHRTIFETFNGNACRLRTRTAVADFLTGGSCADGPALD